jgi:hypothetical protein
MHKKIPLVKAGDDIKARSFNDIIRVVNELSQVGNLTKNGSRRRAYLQPFGVNLFETAASSPVTYYVTVNDGRLVELNRTAGIAQDALILHEANNRVNVGTGLPEKFAIAVNEVIYLIVPEDANGAVIGADVELGVLADGETSTNLIGTQPGIYYYKLAKLVTIDGVPRLKPLLSGSHVYHETGLTADYRVLACPSESAPEEPGEQLARLRFCSGRLAGIDEDVDLIPASSNLVEYNVTTCETFTPP